jgi:hypothetical protein
MLGPAATVYPCCFTMASCFPDVVFPCVSCFHASLLYASSLDVVLFPTCISILCPIVSCCLISQLLFYALSLVLHHFAGLLFLPHVLSLFHFSCVVPCFVTSRSSVFRCRSCPIPSCCITLSCCSMLRTHGHNISQVYFHALYPAVVCLRAVVSCSTRTVIPFPRCASEPYLCSLS